MNEAGEKSKKLLSACTAGDRFSLMKLIKSEHIKPSAYDMIDERGKTALHVACRHGLIDVVRTLVEVYGCSPQAVDNTGCTPFHDACYYDQVVILDYLIHAVSEAMKCLLTVDIGGNTPFHKANESGSSHVVNYMLHVIICSETPRKISLVMDHKLYSRKTFTLINYLLQRNKAGDTPPAVACRHGHLFIIKMYMNYHDLLPIKDVFDMPYILKTANSCGQFEIANYVHNRVMDTPCHIISEPVLRNRHRVHLSRCDHSLDDKCINCYDQPLNYMEYSIVNNSTCWNFNVLVSMNEYGDSFCMAVLQRDDVYVRKFMPRFSHSNICYAACVAEDTDILNKFYEGGCQLKNGNTFLHIACEWGSENAVKYLISNLKGICNINHGNDYGDTPLHVACRHGRVEIVDLLIKSGVCDTLNKPNSSKETPLHLACLLKSPAVAECILNNEQLSLTSIDAPDEVGDTPLMNACRSGNAYIVELLIRKGCSALCVNEYSKETLFHIVCGIERLDILQLLVRNIHDKVDFRDHLGQTPLCIAMNASCSEIVHFLVKKQLCDVSRRLSSPESMSEDTLSRVKESPIIWFGPRLSDIDREEMLRFKYYSMAMRREDVRMRRYRDTIPMQHVSKSSGNTALHVAVKRNDLELVQLLVNYCPLSSANTFGNTAFHIAAKVGNVTLIECLLAKTSDSLDNFLNKDGNSPLHLACETKLLPFVETLLDSCSVTLKNKSGDTPIHVACKNKSSALVCCLLKRCPGNADCYRNNNNDTFLHVAARAGDLDTIKLLLNQCSTTCQNSNDDTPIHIACRANNQLVIECLLDKTESSFPFANKKGQTYLHAACYNEAQLIIVKIIIEKGFKTLGNVPDKQGDTPLHYACRSGETKVVEYLMTSGHCDPYRFNKDGLSPIYFAIKNDLRLVEYIITNQLCDLNQPVKAGSPLLHCIIEQTRIEYHSNRRQLHDYLYAHDELDDLRSHVHYEEHPVSPQLLKILGILTANDKRTIDPNATDINGNTALHLACKLGQHVIVKLLLATDVVSQSISHRNHHQHTPIQLTNDYSIIHLLISYGANPEDVYDHFAGILERSKVEQPLEPAVTVIVLGNSTAGKTTLVEALKSNKGVIHVKGSTAGIDTSKHNSRVFGKVTFHDFAGQPEYESSHSAFLERCSSSAQPPIFILVVDASQTVHIERRIHNWLSFIQNHCTYSTETPPHVIVVGSHIDLVDGDQIPKITNCFSKSTESFKSAHFESFKPVLLDCRKVGTRAMKRLMHRLKESCSSLKKFIELDCRCHILIATLAKWFHSELVVKVKQLRSRIEEHKSSKGQLPYAGSRRWRLEYDPSEVLPISIKPLLQLLKSLHNGGHILLLEATDLEDSWIVMNQDALFKTVNGILFAPKEFERHLEIDNNTGVVPLTKLQELFPHHIDFDMIKEFLVHYEFCQQIKDNETLQLIHGSGELPEECKSLDSHYYFFPGFVQSEKPAKVWDVPDQSDYSYSFGWMLQCQSKQLFDTRFLHILLLRLTFTFVAAASQSTKFKRKCDIWKNGISWGTRNGVEVLFELVEDKTLVLVLVRSFKGQELEAVKLRTAILKMILEVKQEFCPRITPDEYLVHPSDLADVNLQMFKMHRISITEIAQTIIDGCPFVLDSSNKPLSLDSLLCFEPYSRIDLEHLSMFFSKDKADDIIPTETLYNLSRFLHPVYQHLIKVLDIPITDLGYHKDRWRDHPVKMLHHLFESWATRRKQSSFKTLCAEFNDYSIFFGRDPQVQI